MNTDAPDELLEVAVTQRLKTFGDVGGVVANRIYVDNAPQDDEGNVTVDFPLILFSITGNFTNSSPRDDIRFVLSAVCVANDIPTAKQGAAAIFGAFEQLFDGIPGWSNYHLKPLSPFRGQQQEGGSQFYRRGYMYEVRMDRNN